MATCSIFVFQTQGPVLMNLRLLMTRAHSDHAKSKGKHDIGPDEKKYTKACQRGTPFPLALIYYRVSVQMEAFKGAFVWLDKEDSKEKDI